MQPESAARWIVTRHGIAAAMLLEAGEVDAALCGGLGDWTRHLANILPIIPRIPTVSRLYSLSALILPKGALFFCDTHLNHRSHRRADRGNDAVGGQERAPLRPGAQGGACCRIPASAPRTRPSARKMRKALKLIREGGPDFEIDGEMHADAALSDVLRARYRLQQPADRLGQSFGDAHPGCRQYRAYAAVGRHRGACWWGRCCWASPSPSM